MRNCQELFAVIIVAAVLLVALGASGPDRRQAAARRRNCAANLKVLHQVMALYSEDQDGYLPAVVTRCRPKWKFWYDTLQKYSSSPYSFYCPSNPKAKAGLEVDEGEKDLLPAVFDEPSQSYGINYWLSTSVRGSAVLHRSREFASPDYTVLLGDSRGAFLRATKWCWKEDYAPRHEAASNFIMADGHVELMNQENLGLMDRYENWQRDVRRWKNWK